MSDSSSSTASATTAAVGVSVAVVASLVLCGLLYVYIQRRQLAAEAAEPENAGRRSQVLDRMHPASRVTPFSPGQEVPRFSACHCISSTLVHTDHIIVHYPGEAMRIAHRRSDGGWEFSEPLSIQPPPFAHDFNGSVCPSPTASIATTTMFSSRKEKQMLPGELTTRGYLEMDGLGLPPPAYSPRADHR